MSVSSQARKVERTRETAHEGCGRRQQRFSVSAVRAWGEDGRADGRERFRAPGDDEVMDERSLVPENGVANALWKKAVKDPSTTLRISLLTRRRRLR